jgi:hypothetical protein
MSEEPARFGVAHRGTDGDWSVRAVVEAGSPKTYTVVIAEGDVMTRVPLTPTRARALIRELTDMLEASDERVDE